MTADREERRLFLSREASDDLRRIQLWYGQPGAGIAARAKVLRIIGVLERLTDMPCSCKRGSRPGTRQHIVEGHRILFQVMPDTGENATAGDVFVIHIAGPGQLKQGS